MHDADLISTRKEFFLPFFFIYCLWFKLKFYLPGHFGSIICQHYKQLIVTAAVHTHPSRATSTLGSELYSHGRHLHTDWLTCWKVGEQRGLGDHWLYTLLSLAFLANLRNNERDSQWEVSAIGFLPYPTGCGLMNWGRNTSLGTSAYLHWIQGSSTNIICHLASKHFSKMGKITI